MWLCILHRLTHLLQSRGKDKLGPCCVGPFQVVDRVKQVAYPLQLPKGAHLHDVFHVELLKPSRRTPPPTTPPPIQNSHPCGRACVARPIMLGRLTRPVQWCGLSNDDTTWESLHHFKDLYLELSSRTSCTKRWGEML